MNTVNCQNISSLLRLPTPSSAEAVDDTDWFSFLYTLSTAIEMSVRHPTQPGVRGGCAQPRASVLVQKAESVAQPLVLPRPCTEGNAQPQRDIAEHLSNACAAAIGNVQLNLQGKSCVNNPHY